MLIQDLDVYKKAQLEKHRAIHFIGISRGSAAELRYEITLARDLKFIAQNTAEELLKQMDSILQMLSGLMRNTRATYIE